MDIDATYESMWVRNMNTKDINGISVDPVLSADEREHSDPRRCLALITRGHWEFTDEFMSLQAQLKEMFPNQYHYERNYNLHHTFMQLVSFDRFNDVIPTYNFTRANEIVNSVMTTNFKNKTGYTLQFDRICPVSSGLVMLASKPYENTRLINDTRNDIREQLSGQIYEPYVNDICHSTLMRYINRCDGILQHKWDQIQYGVNNKLLATLDVTDIDLMFGSWRMLPNEVNKTAMEFSFDSFKYAQQHRYKY